jgi:hypothetical protein
MDHIPHSDITILVLPHTYGTDVEQGHGCGLVARSRSMEDEFSRTKDAFPRARLALLMPVIHCVKPPSCGVPLGCVVGPGLLYPYVECDRCGYVI